MTADSISIVSRIAASQLQPAQSLEGHPPQQERATTFGEVFAESLQEVNHLQKEADKAIEGLATGDRTDIAQTMIAVQKASLSFEIMKQVRNQLVQAYEEVLRMPV